MLLFHWVQDLMELLQNLFEIKDPAEAQNIMDDLERVYIAPFDPTHSISGSTPDSNMCSIP